LTLLKLKPLPDPDSVPDLPSNPVTLPGDLWILGKHRLICGDSTFFDTRSSAYSIETAIVEVAAVEPGSWATRPSARPRKIP